MIYREMKVLLIGLLCVLAINAMPADVGQADNCGAKKTVKQFKLVNTGEAVSDFECEMCLDLVLISETYAECGEAEEEHKMEHKCDEKYSKNPVEDRACRSMVDKIAHEAIEDTEQDPAAVCYKIIHRHCSYSFL